MISVADTNFFEVFINGEDIEVSEKKSILYRNQYIVNKIERYYNIDFVTFQEFENRLNDYDEIHEYNILFNSKLLRGFWDDLLTDWKKRNFMIDKFNISIDSVIKNHVSSTDRRGLDAFSIDFSYQSELETLFLSSEFITDSTAVEYNNNMNLMNDIAKWLKFWFRYTGKVAFKCSAYDDDGYDDDGYDDDDFNRFDDKIFDDD